MHNTTKDKSLFGNVPRDCCAGAPPPEREPLIQVVLEQEDSVIEKLTKTVAFLRERLGPVSRAVPCREGDCQAGESSDVPMADKICEQINSLNRLNDLLVDTTERLEV